MNWVCALCVIPTFYIMWATMNGSKRAFKEFGRCGGFYGRSVGVNQGEIMNGGTLIRAAESQDFAEKLNNQG
jgi:hypothetical protein